MHVLYVLNETYCSILCLLNDTIFVSHVKAINPTTLHEGNIKKT